jgi:phosphoribosylanthranilate isomerase
VKTVQLHGDEDPTDFDAVRAAGFGVIRATAATSSVAESVERRESSRGVKDPDLIRDFLVAARS